MADAGDSASVGCHRPEAGLGGAGSDDEERGRVRMRQIVGVGGVRRGEGETRRAPDRLAGHRQHFTAGGQDCDHGTASQHAIGQCRGGGEDVLAVVEDEEHVLSAEHPAELLLGLQAAPRAAVDAQRAEDGVGQRSVIGHGGQLDDPGSVPVALLCPGRQLQGQAGLARAAHASDRQEPGLRQ